MLESETPDWDSQVPPWVALPDFPAEGMPAKQGLEELWFDTHWQPFWQALTKEQRQNYLDHWQASAAWRRELAALDALYSEVAEQDLRESEAPATQRAQAAVRRPSLWQRLFGR